jgi:hypothetical protein
MTTNARAALDLDVETAVATRKYLFDRAAADRMFVTGYHFLFTACSHLIKTAAGYEHVPIEWQPTLSGSKSFAGQPSPEYRGKIASTNDDSVKESANGENHEDSRIYLHPALVGNSCCARDRRRSGRRSPLWRGGHDHAIPARATEEVTR